MSDLEILSLDGGTRTVAADALEGLAGQIRGDLVTAASAEYDEVRAIWNGMIDRQELTVLLKLSDDLGETLESDAGSPVDPVEVPEPPAASTSRRGDNKGVSFREILVSED